MRKRLAVVMMMGFSVAGAVVGIAIARDGFRTALRCAATGDIAGWEKRREEQLCGCGGKKTK